MEHLEVFRGPYDYSLLGQKEDYIPQTVTKETNLRFRRVRLKGILNRKIFVVIPGKPAGGESGRHFHVFVTPEHGELLPRKYWFCFK